MLTPKLLLEPSCSKAKTNPKMKCITLTLRMINNDKPRGLNKRFLSFGCAVAEVVGIAKVVVKTNTTQGFKAKEV
jgi:hypothetical protein